MARNRADEVIKKRRSRSQQVVEEDYPFQHHYEGMTNREAAQAERDKKYEEGRQRRLEKQKKLAKKGGGITGLGIAGAGLDALLTYKAERSEDPNGSKAVDAAKAGVVAGAWLVAEPLMWGITAFSMGSGLAKMVYDEALDMESQAKSIEFHVNNDNAGKKKGSLGNGQFIDNEQVATMRQRQEQIMRQHRISTESVLGSEARQLHR